MFLSGQKQLHAVTILKRYFLIGVHVLAQVRPFRPDHSLFYLIGLPLAFPFSSLLFSCSDVLPVSSTLTVSPDVLLVSSTLTMSPAHHDIVDYISYFSSPSDDVLQDLIF